MNFSPVNPNGYSINTYSFPYNPLAQAPINTTTVQPQQDPEVVIEYERSIAQLLQGQPEFTPLSSILVELLHLSVQCEMAMYSLSPEKRQIQQLLQKKWKAFAIGKM